ncbi:hypothetical protein GQX73_g6810 [Xylaria multiplex]|uniref:UBX domain-containing protein 2 n=1 Tax=Xylaria multiplex TaxID=323545 RepID=A0A7C8ILZ1_9PEZI|nr:hypothetical protein GQX73_g6810 [Xylaria multiplex]
MFFQGSLQDGISTALQQSKQVVCFVTDGESESQQWEDEFLTDDSIQPGLESQSVILKLVAGSEEAGYLEALFPVPKKPTIVVIQNGQLKEYIASGTSREEFIRRLSKTISSGATRSQPSSSLSTTAPATNPVQSYQSVTSQPEHDNDSLYDDVQPTAISTGSSVPVQEAQPTTTEEEKRLSAEKKGKARAEAEEEARRRVDERCGCEPPNPEQAHANEVKQRKQQANEERKRILKRIEDDKRARKERDAAERRARSLLSANPDADSSAGEPSIPLHQRLPKAGQGEHCNLQVRLLDGSTIRTRFTSDKTLGSDVRKWIDAERTDGDAPYSFRIVLTPQPNKVIKREEELKSLLSLGLAPSATLVLIPTRYSVAYAGAGGVLSPIIGVFSTLYGAIMSSLGGIFALLFGAGDSGDSPRHDDIPMENLQARRRRDAQLYNGNSLNFEPRNEDEDENNTR